MYGITYIGGVWYGVKELDNCTFRIVCGPYETEQEAREDMRELGKNL